MAKSLTDLSSISDTCWYDDGTDEPAAAKPSLDSFAPVIFGRESETKLLLETFQQVITTKKAATVVVHGESGSGKTSLVDTLRVPVIENGGYFCSGKFFQNSALQEPYSAVMAAFSDICDVVSQSDDFHKGRQIEIRQAMGEDGHLLRTVISNISSLLGDASEFTNDGSTHIVNGISFSKFKLACKIFMQAVSSDKHPLVLFIDDIQWMDAGSRELIELFLNDTELKNVMLILSYRDEEAEKIFGVVQNHAHVVDIPVTNLDASAIHEIISAMTKSKSEDFRELSILTESRSSGNAFHVQEFLEMIQMEGFLTYDDEADTWIFDVDEIRSSVMILHSLADLISRKIGLVGEDMRETLKVASLIGYDFDETVLLAAASFVRMEKYELSVSNESVASSSVTESLREAVGIGFIEHIKGGFQFTHDKIQTAFQEMIGSEEEVQRVHQIIGQTIVDIGDDDDATMYQAVVHFNSASAHITHEADVYRWVQMNLRAAKYCMSKSAFEASSDLLQFGLGTMDPSQRWSEKFFALSFEMTELLAKAYLVIGQFDNCKAATTEALLHATSTEMKIKSLLLELDAREANLELNEFIPSANRVLLALGFKMPKLVTKGHVILKFLQIKFMIRKMTDDRVLSLPKNNDSFTSTAVNILTKLCTVLLLQDKENHAVYSALKAFELTLKHGMSPSSPVAFVAYGTVELTLGNYDEAYRFGKLGLNLLETIGSKTSVPATVGVALSLITYRKEPLADLKRELNRAGEVGFELGDIWYGAYCIAQGMLFDMMLGTNLSNLELSVRSAMHRVIELGQDAMLMWFKPILQVVLNMQSHPSNWDDVVVLSGEAMCEEKFIVEAKKANQPILVATVLMCKCSLACHFSYYEVASNVCTVIETLGKAARMSYGQISFIFSASLSNYELYRVSKRRKHLRRALNYKNEMRKLRAQGCTETEPWYEFLLVVELSLKSSLNIDSIANSYNHSISKISQHGHCHLEGLLNEHAGFDLARRGDVSKAIPYFKRALQIYRSDWCVEGKYEWLIEKISQYDSTLKEGPFTMNPHIGDLIVCDPSCKRADVQPSDDLSRKLN